MIESQQMDVGIVDQGRNVEEIPVASDGACNVRPAAMRNAVKYGAAGSVSNNARAHQSTRASIEMYVADDVSMPRSQAPIRLSHAPVRRARLSSAALR